MDKDTAARAVVLCGRLSATLGDPRPGLESWVRRRDDLARQLRDLLVGHLRPSTPSVAESRDLLAEAREAWPGLWETLVQSYRDVEIVSLGDVRETRRRAEVDEADLMANVALLAFVDHVEETAETRRCGHCDQPLPINRSTCAACGATTVQRGSAMVVQRGGSRPRT